MDKEVWDRLIDVEIHINGISIRDIKKKCSLYYDKLKKSGYSEEVISKCMWKYFLDIKKDLV